MNKKTDVLLVRLFARETKTFNVPSNDGSRKTNAIFESVHCDLLLIFFHLEIANQHYFRFKFGVSVLSRVPGVDFFLYF